MRIVIIHTGFTLPPASARRPPCIHPEPDDGQPAPAQPARPCVPCPFRVLTAPAAGPVFREFPVIRRLPRHPLALALGGALLLSASPAVLAQSTTGTTDEAAPAAALRLPTLHVADQTGTPDTYASGRQLDATYIGQQAAGNGDIGSLLKINPAVQFDNAQLSGYTPGEISAAEVSINGAAFYQNNFTLDGMGMNNAIDPGTEKSPYRLYGGPGSSQAMAVDTRLLGEITVLDSNISAAWGGFTGGVVEATTRKPSRQARSEISVQTTRSGWTRYHLDPAEAQSYENASAWGDGQPSFEKTTWRATTEGWLSDDVGVLASFTRKRATIPTMFYSSHLVGQFGNQQQDQERAIDNVFVKAVWEANERMSWEASVMVAPEENTYFRSNTADSWIDVINGGKQATLRLDWRTDWGTVKQSLGYTVNEQSRQADSSSWYTWYYSDSKDWGTGNQSLAGEYGHVEQTQESLQYKIDLGWDAITTGALTHRFKAGAQLGRDAFEYARLTESSIYVLPKSTSTCTNRAGIEDTQTCALGTTHTTTAANNNWPGQYFTQRTRYATGAFGFTTVSGALYVEDDIRIGDVSLRPGLRVERDDYMSQTTLAPRLAASWDVAGDGSRLLQAGANRYYGRSMAKWRLHENINRLRYNNEKRATLDDAWTLGTQAAADMRFADLDIAYDDELMLGFTQRLDGLTLGAKVVDRQGHDQVIQVKGTTLDAPSTNTGELSAGYTTWTNGGRSHNRIWSLTAEGSRPLLLAGTVTSWLAAIDWTDNIRSAPTYFDDSDDYYDNPLIQYMGQVIDRADLPADNFTRPWTVRLAATTLIPQWDLSVSTLLRYRAGYQDIGDTGINASVNGQSVDVFDRRDFSATLNWDVRISWDKPLAGQQSAFVNLDIFNLLDRRNVTSVSTSAVPQYETGRSFWVELGYRF